MGIILVLTGGVLGFFSAVFGLLAFEASWSTAVMLYFGLSILPLTTAFALCKVRGIAFPIAPAAKHATA